MHSLVLSLVKTADIGLLKIQFDFTVFNINKNLNILNHLCGSKFKRYNVEMVKSLSLPIPVP